MKILVTCPPMLQMMDSFKLSFEAKGIGLTCPEVVQILPIQELVRLVPEHDGWIIGDDPATKEVFEAGRKGNLKAAIKWGIGVDNVDFEAAKRLGIVITNTPNMFGREVADIAISYLTSLAREMFMIDRSVRAGGWPKPRGVSLAEKTVALVGFGDIGKNTAKRLLAADMRVIAYDPVFSPASNLDSVQHAQWPEKIEEADFIVVTCSLTQHNRHMLNREILGKTKKGVRIINVSRGPLIDEQALIEALHTGHVHSAALDVFEVEPLPQNSPLRRYEQCIFGSHNASNTSEAVLRTSRLAIQKLFTFLGVEDF